MLKSKNIVLNATINRTRLILSFILFFIVGALFLSIGFHFLDFLAFILYSVFIYNGFSDIVKGILSVKSDKYLNITSGLLNIVLGTLVFLFQDIGKMLIPIIIGIYSILNGIIKIVVIYTYKKSKEPYGFTILECSLFFIIGILTIFSPIIHMNELITFIGIYFILFSFTFFMDFLRDILPSELKIKIKSKINISVPVVLTAMIPYKALQSVNKYLSTSYNGDKVPDDIPDYEEKNNDEEPGIEIFIHVTEKGFGTIGHMDIVFDGEFISYGNYDDSSLKFFECVGDGVLFIANKSKYIPFCIENSRKTLFSFGIKLTDNEKKIVRYRLKKIQENTCVWDPPIVRAIRMYGKDNVNTDDYTDYTSELITTTGATTFKFTSSKFKTYFVLGTNCGFLVDTLLRGHDTNIISLTGVISPGAYLDFLNKEFYKKNSKVITKRIYN